MAIAHCSTASSTSSSAICGDDHVFTGPVGAVQPRACAGSVPCPQLGGAHPAGRRAADLGGADLRGRQARESPRDPGRAARGRDRPDRRRRPAASRDPRRHQADEPDPRDRPRQPHRHRQSRDQHAQAQRGAAQARLHLSRRPRVLPVLAGRRADRHERLVADRRPLRPHARPRDLVRDRAADRRDHPRRRRRRPRRSASPRAATSSSICSWATRERWESSPRRRSSWSNDPRPSSRCSSPTATTWTRGGRPASWRAPASRRSPASCCSTNGRSPTCAATMRPTSRSPTRSRPWSPARRTETPTRCRVGAKRLLRIGKASGGTYLGDEISQGDWASRHDRYATPQHGRTRDGQVALMSWHCEDASIPYPELPAVREKWHAIAARPVTSGSTCSTTGECSPTPMARSNRGATTWRRSTSASGR